MNMPKKERPSNQTQAKALRFLADFIEGYPEASDTHLIDGWRAKCVRDYAAGERAVLTLRKAGGTTMELGFQLMPLGRKDGIVTMLRAQAKSTELRA